MSLTITDEETCALARELAELTGETVTEAITVALRERHREVERRFKAIRELRERIAPHIGPGPSAVEHGDWLYDEHGLPK